METLRTLGAVGGMIVSFTSVALVVVVTVRHFMLKNRPSYMHIAMHFLRRKDGKLVLKMPTLKVFKLPDLYEYITSTWLLFSAASWSKQSPFAPILSIPDRKGTSWLLRLMPERKHFLRPIMQWLSAENFEDWRDRAARAARDPDADPQEEQFVFALVYDDDTRSLRGLVVPVKVLERFVNEPDTISDDPHPNYAGAQDRPEVMRIVAKAWSEWSTGSHPTLAMGLLEL